jgi:hypothetical protein
VKCENYIKKKKKETTSGHIKNKLPHFYVYRIIRNIKITWKKLSKNIKNILIFLKKI